MSVDQYAVFGNPIKHSRSPQIHESFAEQSGEAIEYHKQCVDVDGFNDAVKQFFAASGKGLNITVPFKLEAYELADTLTKRARQAGAVNTLALQSDGTIVGDNTDGVGMVRDITEHLVWPIKGKRVLILGAGGAVRGVLGPVLEQCPASVVIANRTASKAASLAKAFDGDCRVVGCGYEALEGFAFDLIINGTSASLAGDLPPLSAQLLAPGARCYDMMYGSEATVFMRWAGEHGAITADGLGMLVGQAAESFALWRGVTPAVKPVIAAIRQQLAG
ncbi:Shikimate dehydrogenase (NADP(+)) [Sinobacterium norvegicum]|uniref:Shikimate dehydrogenase (NADP(+)) n=1 Tax=Sinobacterium norvegicum TaxID=1641715 RepID=A0ABN8EP23_9GAMM|nr:shikimate dehydrogenase [Sinobacterium norvegicum]CAH0993000.1 Shikimate dehydrogenase (NADP(+)) [Sinobacterium norvegicum]